MERDLTTYYIAVELKLPKNDLFIFNYLLRASLHRTQQEQQRLTNRTACSSKSRAGRSSMASTSDIR